MYRHLIIAFLALIALVSAAFGQVWEPQDSGTKMGLWDVAFANDSVGWAVGDSGLVLGTKDGGLHWLRLRSDSGLHLQHVIALDGLTLRVVGSRVVNHVNTSFLLSSNDGGVTWQQRQFSETDEINDLFFLNKSLGWSVGLDKKKHEAEILKTVDGGEHWNPLCAEPGMRLLSVWFTDSLHGCVAGYGLSLGEGGVLLRTTDGGVSWNKQEPRTRTLLTHIQFSDPQNGWVAGGEEGEGVLIHTSDAGANWSQLDSLSTGPLTHPVFTDAKTGWVIMSTEMPSYTIRHTSDGGATWMVQRHAEDEMLQGMTFTNAMHGWAVGNGGLILRYHPGQ